MTEPAHSDDPAYDLSAAPAPSDERVRAPRPRRIPRSRAQHARLDAREPAFEPLPFPSYSLDDARRPFADKLALARLTHWRPGLQVWGLSATLGNLSFATEVLLAPVATPRVSVHGALTKALIVDTIIPDTIERFPWGGHMGMRQVDAVARAIDEARTSLVFTNTRSQCEVWYQALLEARPEWVGVIALHHGSLDQQVREWVERGLKNGLLKVVVCTSSLDLGVDFLPVERVFQIGATKGVARLMQRAGRSGHAPGLPSRVTIVPTHALELIEAAAAREAVDKQQIESRDTPQKPFDVLVQHLVTVAIGGGFDALELYDELLHTYAYRDLTQQEFDWTLGFVEGGGATLQWAGSRMPLWSELADATLTMLARAADGIYDELELRAVRPLLELQQKWSALPEPGVLVVELLKSREGHHFFCYPFAGRTAHIGLGALLAWRVAREKPGTFSISINDYGFELLCAQAFDWAAQLENGLLSPDELDHDILASLNSSELSLRRFREIARVSGLVFQAHPGQQKSARQLQASSGLFYQIFRQHDRGNLLLGQADTEVLLQELDVRRIRFALERMNANRVVLARPKKPTPFAFPLIVGRLREKVSTEKLADRVERMLAELERAAQR
ncbi:helicase-related protein [Paraburkholderia sp. MM5482-R1]|uniref:helicase-related protein n=1 Tax=unclassified Paraburkholderia TaxID=2615204 RepID=UPI003D20E6B7